MLVCINFGQYRHRVPLAATVVLVAIVLSAPASVNDDFVKVADARAEERSVGVPISKTRPSNARHLSRNQKYFASYRRRFCTYLGCRGHHLLGIGF